MASPAIRSSRSSALTSLPPRRKSWSRTTWFHIAVGAEAKNGKQITVAVAALASGDTQCGTVPAQQQQPAENDQESDELPRS